MPHVGCNNFSCEYPFRELVFDPLPFCSFSVFSSAGPRLSRIYRRIMTGVLVHLLSVSFLPLSSTRLPICANHWQAQATITRINNLFGNSPSFRNCLKLTYFSKFDAANLVFNFPARQISAPVSDKQAGQVELFWCMICVPKHARKHNKTCFLLLKFEQKQNSKPNERFNCLALLQVYQQH